MDKDLLFRIVDPEPAIADFVESFWMLHNTSGSEKEIVVLPDGRIELTLSRSLKEPFHITRSGIETHPQPATIDPGTLIFAVSFKLPATEYIFHDTISNFLNYAERLPVNFWDFKEAHLDDFDSFVKYATGKIKTLLPLKTDPRKLHLFELIYSSLGMLPVKELSEKVGWSSRQINRYFTQQYGVSLKEYCNILRFRESLHHLAKGDLYPPMDFTDQSHFIKEVKKFSGVIPKELLKNKNDRFIQFSTLKPE